MESDRNEKGAEERSPIGRRNLGKYRLLASIGRGGMGEVYLAMSHGPAGFKKLVVLKCMHADSADDENLRTMFLDEAMLAARLSHHNVVQTYEAGELDGLPYIAMEYLEGQPLSRVTRAVPVMAPRFAAHIMSEVLAGLHYAHQLKDFDGSPLAIVHRDLSPPNIFVTYEGVVKVVDFGIAKTSLASRVKTDAGTFKGKISYMAPEQALLEEIDHRADIFSAGAVLWELVAGKRLFRDNSPALTLKRLLHDEIPSLASERPDVAPELDAIVRRALQRSPADRYEDALQMRKDLQRFLRESDATNVDSELAVLMGDKFSRHRVKTQQQVQMCMTGWEEGQEALPSVNLTDGVTGKSGMRFVPPSIELTIATATMPATATIPATATMRESISGVGVITPGLSPAPSISLTAPLLSSTQALVGTDAPQAGPLGQSVAPRSRLQRMGMVVAFGALITSAATVASMVISSRQSAAYEVTSLQTAAPTSASLTIISMPPGAMVFVNGEPSGLVTPAVLKGLPVGRSVRLRLDKAGYLAKEEQVEIAEAKASTRTFQLVVSDGEVRLAGAPAGAQVYIDDVAVQDGAQQTLRVPVGTRRLRVETNGTLLFARTVEIVPGEQTIQIADVQGKR